MITEAMLKAEFRKYSLPMMQEFLQLFMPPPLADKRYRYITIKTADKVPMKVWGKDLQDIWDQLQRFSRIGVFI